MSDRVFLSLWFRAQPAPDMLPRLARAVESLPPEVQAAGIRGLAVHPISWSEPPVLEERFPGGVPLPDAIETMREFLHEDCAFEVAMEWPLWRWSRQGWISSQDALRIAALGESFEDGAWRDQGHVYLDFGLDDAFLAESAPWGDDTRRHLEFNILRLLGLARALQDKLQPERRMLWTEGHADLTARLLTRLKEAGA